MRMLLNQNPKQEKPNKYCYTIGGAKNARRNKTEFFNNTTE